MDFAAAILVLEDGRIVLQKRDNNALTSPGLVSLFGGGIEMGEDPMTAVIRELGEETSLSLTSDDFGLLVSYPKLSDTESTAYIYVAKIHSLDFEVFEGAGRVVSTIEDALERRDFSPSAKVALLYYAVKQGVKNV